MANNSEEPSQAPKAPLLGLPVELRLIIYDHLFPTRRGTVEVPSLYGQIYPTGLIRTCHQIHAETLPRVQRILSENTILLRPNFKEINKFDVLMWTMTEDGRDFKGPPDFAYNTEIFLSGLSYENRCKLQHLVVDFSTAFAEDFPNLVDYLMRESSIAVRTALKAAAISVIARRLPQTLVRLDGLRLSKLRLDLPGLDEQVETRLIISDFREGRTALFERQAVKVALEGVSSDVFEVGLTTDFDGRLLLPQPILLSPQLRIC
jgi:hypothetical protein